MELYLVGRGQRELLKTVSRRDGLFVLLLLVLQVAATVIAGMEYFQPQTVNDDDHRLLAAAAAGEDAATVEENSSMTNHIPILLCLLVPVLYYTALTVRVVFLFPNDGSHKKIGKTSSLL
jgi:hypothetical protein